MTEYHDPSGDEQDDLLQPDTDLPGDRADALPEHAPPPLDDLGSPHADAAPELHFPGDEIADPAGSAELDPAAPWPDDSDFATWLGAPEPAGAADTPAAPEPAGAADTPAAGDDVVEQLRATPEAESLPPAAELVDWTLRHVGDRDG